MLNKLTFMTNFSEKCFQKNYFNTEKTLMFLTQNYFNNEKCFLNKIIKKI